MAGIASLAFYLPPLSIRAEAYGDRWEASRAPGVREKTVAGFDEDEVTMAVAAARGVRLPERVGYLGTATLHGPPLSPVVAVALGIEGADAKDFEGSTNASGEALRSCLDFVEANDEAALHVAATAPQGDPDEAAEHPAGAAATALVLGPGGGLEIEALAAHAIEIREEAGPAVGENGGMDIARTAIQAAAREAFPERGVGRVAPYEPDGEFAGQALKGVVEPKRVGGGVVELSGDTGCVSPLLALAEVAHRAREGDRLGLVSYGRGAAVAAVLRLRSRLDGLRSPMSTLRAPREYLDHPTYVRYRRYQAGRDPGAEVSQGAYVSLPTYLEAAAARYRLAASQCTTCGRVEFPPRPVCLRCGGHDLVEQALSGRGKVYARTIIAEGSSPSEFQAQQDLIGSYAVAVIQLEEGPRVIAQVTETEPRDVVIGMPVEAVLRRIYRQEGVVRYGFKFRPVAAQASSATDA